MDFFNSPGLVILFSVILIAALGFIFYVISTLKRDSDKKRQEQTLLQARLQEEKKKQEQGNLFRAIMQEAKNKRAEKGKDLEEELAKHAGEEFGEKSADAQGMGKSE